VATRFTKKELQSKSISELEQIKKELLQSKSISELQQIKNQLQQSKRRTPVPSQPVTEQIPNQVTLPNGDTITIPIFDIPENLKPPPSISTREEFNTCCTGEPTDMVYPHADWCYSFTAVQKNYLMVRGTIYIDGVPSTNPQACLTEFWDEGLFDPDMWPDDYFDCTTSFTYSTLGDMWPADPYMCCGSSCDGDLNYTGGTRVDCAYISLGVVYSYGGQEVEGGPGSGGDWTGCYDIDSVELWDGYNHCPAPEIGPQETDEWCSSGNSPVERCGVGVCTDNGLPPGADCTDLIAPSSVTFPNTQYPGATCWDTGISIDNNTPIQEGNHVIDGECDNCMGEDNWHHECLCYHFGNRPVHGCYSKRTSFPNYCMNEYNEPTGNCDAIAPIWNGIIAGFEFVNNITFDPTGPDPPIGVPGISLPIMHLHPEGPDCFPDMGDTIDNLLLYKASTGEYYQLTEESYGVFINAINPMTTPFGVTIINDDLYFEPADITPGEPDCFVCEQYNNDYNDTGDDPYNCTNTGKTFGCNWRDMQDGDPTIPYGCYCANPNAGCCPTVDTLPEQTINQCRTNDNCREGSVCRRGQCVVIPVGGDGITPVPRKIPKTKPRRMQKGGNTQVIKIGDVVRDVNST